MTRHRLISAWRNLLHRDRIDRELGDELHATYEQLVDESIGRGRLPADARREARLMLNGIEPVKEQVRQSRAGARLEAILRDFNYALRTLRRSPSFTISAVLSLTLGITAITLVFSVVNGVLLRSLPIPDAERLMFVARVLGADTTTTRPLTYADYRVFQERNTTFTDMAAYTQFPVSFEIGGEVRRHMPAFVTGNYFDVLGVQPAMGRLITPADDRDGSPPVVVLNYDVWVSTYNADPRILGSTLRLTAGRAAGSLPDMLYTIVGIGPKDFHGTDVSVRPPAWMPLHTMMPEARLATRHVQGPGLSAFGRLKPGIFRTAAQANITAVARELAREHPKTNAGYQAVVAENAGWLRNWPVMRAFSSATLLLAGLVLLAACASLASGLIVRTIDRHREIGIRISLGATRMRIVRLMLIEVLVIAALSGALALAIVAGTTRALSQFAVPGDQPILVDVRPDVTVFLLATAVALLAAAIATFVAGRAVAGIDPNRSLKGLDGIRPGGGWTVRDALTAAQVAFSCVLMGACVLSLVGLRRALTVPIGFEADRVATVTIDFDVAKYSREQQHAFMQRAAGEVRRVPGVEAVAYVAGVPLGLVQNDALVVPEGMPSAVAPVHVSRNLATADSFRAMRVPMRGGRALSDHDTAKAVVNEAFVRQVLQSRDSLGARVRLGGAIGGNAPPAEPFEIVGIVADGKYASLSEAPQPAIFTPLYDTPFGRPTMIVRTAGSPAAMAATVRRTLASLDPRLPMRNVGSAEQLIAPAFLGSRAAAATLSAFGLVAMLLAITSIHAVVSYSVSKRRREIGVRVALGATRRRVARLVVQRVAVVTSIGIAVGLVATVAFSRVLAQIVYMASAGEPVVIAGVIVVMLLATALALVGPTIRSLRIEPMVALRSE